MSARHRGAVVLAGVAAFAAVASGCGIRTTSVPVDAGAAPSRVPCSVAGKGAATAQPRTGVAVRVYLVCASQLEAVERATLPEESAEKTAGKRPAFAQVLVDELRAEPSEAERNAGFTSSVKGALTVSAGRKRDPEGTLRLSRQPEDLPATALAQIVCTFADNVLAGSDGTVVLGGPGDYPAHGYKCTEGIKENPESALPLVATVPSPSGS